MMFACTQQQQYLYAWIDADEDDADRTPEPAAQFNVGRAMPKDDLMFMYTVQQQLGGLKSSRFDALIPLTWMCIGWRDCALVYP